MSGLAPSAAIARPKPSTQLALQTGSFASSVALLLAFAVLVAAWAIDSPLAVSWALGLAVGVVLQRGRVCFAGAFRDLHLMRNGSMLRAVLVGLAIAIPAFALIQARAVPNPEFGALPPGAHVAPIGLHLVIGGLLFGIGMVVAGGCVSGTLYRIGEGYLASWASLGGILVGLVIATHTWNAWWTWHIQSMPTIWLPAMFGYGGAVALTLGVLAALYIAILWWETRGASAPPFTLPGKTSTPPTTFADHLRQARATFLGKGWPAVVAVSVLAGLNVLAYLADHPLGVTGELAAWGDRGASLIGLGAPALLGADLLAGCNLVLERLGLVSSSTMLDGGLVAGALLGATAAGEFKLRMPKQKRRYVQSLAGGSLMGYGAGIAIGCTLGAFFSAIPSLGLSGWIFGASLLVGAGIGTRIIRRIA